MTTATKPRTRSKNRKSGPKDPALVHAMAVCRAAGLEPIAADEVGRLRETAAHALAILTTVSRTLSGDDGIGPYAAKELAARVVRERDEQHAELVRLSKILEAQEQGDAQAEIARLRERLGFYERSSHGALVAEIARLRAELGGRGR